MQLIQTTHFKRDYKKLPTSIQKRTDEKLKFLVQNVSHPSLRVKRVQKYKGGAGKTTTAINLAAALAEQNKKILLLDSDP